MYFVSDVYNYLSWCVYICAQKFKLFFINNDDDDYDYHSTRQCILALILIITEKLLLGYIIRPTHDIHSHFRSPTKYDFSYAYHMLFICLPGRHIEIESIPSTKKIGKQGQILSGG